MSLRLLTYYKIKGANAAADTRDVVIPADKTYLIYAIDFTAPAQQKAGVKLIVDPAGSNTIVSCSQGDKYVQLPSGQPVTDKTIRIELDNSNNSSGALLGATIYYEEIPE